MPVWRPAHPLPTLSPRTTHQDMQPKPNLATFPRQMQLPTSNQVLNTTAQSPASMCTPAQAACREAVAASRRSAQQRTRESAPPGPSHTQGWSQACCAAPSQCSVLSNTVPALARHSLPLHPLAARSATCSVTLPRRHQACPCSPLPAICVLLRPPDAPVLSLYFGACWWPPGGGNCMGMPWPMPIIPGGIMPGGMPP